MGQPWRFDDLSVGGLVTSGTVSLFGLIEVPIINGALNADTSNDGKVYVNSLDGTLVYHIGANRYKVAGGVF